jgi:hypothetical protein
MQVNLTNEEEFGQILGGFLCVYIQVLEINIQHSITTARGISIR